MSVSARDIVIALTIKYKGDWDRTLSAIQNKEEIKEDEVKTLIATIPDMVKVITILDSDYPEKLKQGFKPPFCLFALGNLDLLKSTKIIGVCGTRENPDQASIESVSNDMAMQQDIVLVSGLSKGTCEQVINRALISGIKIIGVLANGLDKMYPQALQPQLNSILANNGLIITTYPNGVEAKPNNFMERNRVVAALCDKLLAFQFKQHSGTMLTIQFALNNNKDIYVIPTTIQENIEQDWYNNNLIEEGANIYTQNMWRD